MTTSQLAGFFYDNIEQIEIMAKVAFALLIFAVLASIWDRRDRR